MSKYLKTIKVYEVPTLDIEFIAKAKNFLKV